ncbi:cullin-1-like [Rhododendron vialii]|uniref:cullin-1-like n=1 Tax=Rhododendron vialii TaxID=182163 RepID=UPI00265F2C0A|nr:cullin-1-like [Rhododendron vialii]
MQPEQTVSNMENRPNREQLECSCFTEDDCKQHDLTPDKRFSIMEEAIEKVKRLADGTDVTPFSSEEYMMYFSCAFFFSSIRFYGSYTGILYEKFVAALQDNILGVILPALDGKEDVPLLMEIMDLWSKYKILAHWLLRFFEPLRPFCSITRGANISDVPYRLICDGVFDPMWSRFRGAVMRLINQERAGIMVDRDIIKAAIRLFVEVDDKGKRFYYRNFEQVLLTDIHARYAKLAQDWISDCSFDEYIGQALDCIEMEETRMVYYLPRNTMANVIEAMKYEFLEKQTRSVVELLFRGCPRSR